jgi:hypothetical protein
LTKLAGLRLGKSTSSVPFRSNPNVAISLHCSQLAVQETERNARLLTPISTHCRRMLRGQGVPEHSSVVAKTVSKSWQPIRQPIRDKTRRKLPKLGTTLDGKAQLYQPVR